MGTKDNEMPRYKTMTVGGVELRSQVSLGNVLQILVLLIGGVAMWVNNENRLGQVEKRSVEIVAAMERNQLQVTAQMAEKRGRLGVLEIANARSEEKFNNILEALNRIERQMRANGDVP